jgi:hypothetical protein
MTHSDSHATDQNPAAEASEEPGKKHGDPLLDEVEGSESPAEGGETGTSD